VIFYYPALRPSTVCGPPVHRFVAKAQPQFLVFSKSTYMIYPMVGHHPSRFCQIRAYSHILRSCCAPKTSFNDFPLCSHTITNPPNHQVAPKLSWASPLIPLHFVIPLHFGIRLCPPPGGIDIIFFPSAIISLWLSLSPDQAYLFNPVGSKRKRGTALLSSWPKALSQRRKIDHRI
jgi:hypothetical protein